MPTTEIPIDPIALRAQMRHYAFALDRTMKNYTVYGGAVVPGKEISKQLETALQTLAQAGVAKTAGDVRYAQRILRRYERFSRKPVYRLTPPAKAMPAAQLRAVEAAIRQRRSVRHWQDRPVPTRVARRLIQAGLWAPSGCDSQPMRFIVLSGSETRKRFNQLVPHQQFTRAPMIIIVAMDYGVLAGEHTMGLDAGAAVQNMLLEAHALGLGACWMGQKRLLAPEVHALFNLPERIRINSAIVLGYPLDTPETPGRISIAEALLAVYE